MTHDTSKHADDGRPHPSVGHMVPVRILVTVALALLVLTGVTVAVSLIPLGRMNLLVALVIAVIKGSLVVMYFMHLRYDRPINAIILVSSLVFLALFIGLAMMDSMEYQDEIIDRQAPALQRQ
ncbi:MAG: cytochrome C oxidase subunit IV family protein [Planctomycetes bacterium]|nr:cytochrome C oxidase subunit IV family protein [Planctomycetota bacterium]